jgi:hypothetical protein
MATEAARAVARAEPAPDARAGCATGAPCAATRTPLPWEARQVLVAVAAEGGRPARRQAGAYDPGTLVVRAVPGIALRAGPDGRSPVSLVARDGRGPHPATTTLLGSDPYEMPRLLLAWAPPVRYGRMPSSTPVRTVRSPPSASTRSGSVPPRQEYTKSTGRRSAVDDGGAGIDHGAGVLKRTCGELLPRWCTMWSPHSSSTGSPAVGGGGCRRCRVDDQVVRSGVSRAPRGGADRPSGKEAVHGRAG